LWCGKSLVRKRQIFKEKIRLLKKQLFWCAKTQNTVLLNFWCGNLTFGVR
jgi:hypothetical protein